MIKVSKPHQYQIDTINAAADYLETAKRSDALIVLRMCVVVNETFRNDPEALAKSFRSVAGSDSTFRRMGAYKLAQRILLNADRV